MKANIQFIIILILVVSPVKGQDQDSLPSHRYRSVDLRFGQNQIREMNLLPLVHRGTVTELSFESEKVNHTLQQFQILFTYSRIKTNPEELVKSGNIRLGSAYSYNFPVYRNNYLQYYAGPQTLLLYSFMIYPNWDESHSYWGNYLTVGVNNVLSYSRRSDREWVTSLGFSLAGFFSRPENERPFKMDDYTAGGVVKALNSNIEAGLMNKVLVINFKTEYRFPFLSGKREAVSFSTDIIRLSGNDGYPFFQIINRLGIKIML